MLTAGTLRRIAATGLVLVAASAASLAVPRIAVAGDPCYHDFTMPASTLKATTRVDLQPCAFGPTLAQVPAGGTVTFVNGSGFAHLVTGANQEWGSRDTELRAGATVSYTFDKPGVYPYSCALHRGMTGAIVVGDLAAGATIPDAAGAAPAAAGQAGTGQTAGAVADPAVVAAIAVGGALIVVIASGALLALRRRPSTGKATG